MTDQLPKRNGFPRLRRALVVTLALSGVGCAAAAPDIPEPRPIVNYQGARLRVDRERMRAINEWVTEEQTNITEDPSFWVISDLAVEEVYPWDGVRIGIDSVRVRVDPRNSDSQLVHQLYGHLQLMVRMGRQEQWLPEAPTATGYELERAILARTADAWLLGRTVFDTPPYNPLDELMYAAENGYLDAFIFTARPDEFGEARAVWARENPDQAREYLTWFRATFNREPPGLRN